MVSPSSIVSSLNTKFAFDCFESKLQSTLILLSFTTSQLLGVNSLSVFDLMHL